MIAPVSNRLRLFGIEIDELTEAGAADRILDWAAAPFDRCRFVVTPNVDHLVQLRSGSPLRMPYGTADLIVADGVPLVVASRMLGRPLPERVNGTNLTVRVLATAAGDRPLRVYLFGAGPGVAERAAREIERRWPNVSVVGTACPPLGFDKDAAEDARQVAAINAAAPDVLIVGLGAPKQELWAHAHRHDLNAKVALCVGATIDFLAGEKPRAPAWMQRTGLEWLHRLASEPRRLFRRYATDAFLFPAIVYSEWRRLRTARRTPVLGRTS